jgi:hypothetical protein
MRIRNDQAETSSRDRCALASTPLLRQEPEASSPMSRQRDEIVNLGPLPLGPGSRQVQRPSLAAGSSYSCTPPCPPRNRRNAGMSYWSSSPGRNAAGSGMRSRPRDGMGGGRGGGAAAVAMAAVSLTGTAAG